MSRHWLFLVALFLLLSGCARAQTGAPLAEWRPGSERGLRLLSGADGVVEMTERGGSRCAALKPGTTPASSYMYFDVDDAIAAKITGPVYLTVEYFDEGPGGALTVQYDSAAGDTLADRYRPAEDSAGGLSLASRTWKTAALRLDEPRFQNRENLGADFRLTGMPLFIRRVTLTAERPRGWETFSRLPAEELKPLVTIGAGGELTVGGWDPARPEDGARLARALETNVPALKRMGVTSHEGYVRWNLCEVAPGQYDWSTYDHFVDVYRRTGLKWVPFLIAGPAYTLPKWYYDGPEKQGYVCLEHDKETDVQSLWNPAMRRHVKEFLKAFAAHYRGSGVIESVLLGITGNYGEAIYPASGLDWTADVYGPYHTHPGYWAGDPYAEASFRAAMRGKYRRIGRLNDAWGTKYAAFDDIKTFIPEASGLSRRARLDMVDWYIQSMNDWAKFWMTEARRDFPKNEIYLCTGGNAPPEHGSDFGDQCKIAASVHGGVRITNEASDYTLNFSLTRWVASAGQQYGAYYAFEPAAAVTADGVVARIYNATASGARGLHYYYDNLFGNAQASANFARYGSMFQQRAPITEVAVYYPETDIRLNGQHFLEALRPLRDRFDFDVVSDGQIQDGGLRRAKALILLQGKIAEADTWERIADWVRDGGVIFYADGLGRLETVEGKDAALMPLLRGTGKAEDGRVVVFHGPPGADYRAFLAQSLAKAPELSEEVRAAIAADGREDGMFVTLCAPDTLLWLNTTDEPHTRGAVDVPAHGIAEGKLSAG